MKVHKSRVLGTPLRGTIDQTPPGSGTQYDFSVKPSGRIRVLHAYLVCTWTVQPSPLNLVVTFKDGTVHTWTKTNPVSITGYNMYGYLSANAITTQNLEATNNALRNAFALEGDITSIKASITGGTVQNLTGYIIWQVID